MTGVQYQGGPAQSAHNEMATIKTLRCFWLILSLSLSLFLSLVASWLPLFGPALSVIDISWHWRWAPYSFISSCYVIAFFNCELLLGRTFISALTNNLLTICLTPVAPRWTMCSDVALTSRAAVQFTSMSNVQLLVEQGNGWSKTVSFVKRLRWVWRSDLFQTGADWSLPFDSRCCSPFPSSFQSTREKWIK